MASVASPRSRRPNALVWSDTPAQDARKKTTRAPSLKEAAHVNRVGAERVTPSIESSGHRWRGIAGAAAAAPRHPTSRDGIPPYQVGRHCGIAGPTGPSAVAGRTWTPLHRIWGVANANHRDGRWRGGLSSMRCCSSNRGRGATGERGTERGPRAMSGIAMPRRASRDGHHSHLDHGICIREPTQML